MDIFNERDVSEVKNFAMLGNRTGVHETLATALTLMPREEQGKFAKHFSEDCYEYEKWMLNLWGNGIPTLGGCSGLAATHKQPTFWDKIKDCIEIGKSCSSAKDKVLGMLDELVSANPHHAYSGIILTKENKKKVAAILENLSETDKQDMVIDINLDCPRPSMSNESRDIMFYIPEFFSAQKGIIDQTVLCRKGKLSNTPERASKFFGRLNTAFEHAKKKGLSSDMSIRKFQADMKKELPF